jgi:hypothetical protein
MERRVAEKIPRGKWLRDRDWAFRDVGVAGEKKIEQPQWRLFGQFEPGLFYESITCGIVGGITMQGIADHAITRFLPDRMKSRIICRPRDLFGRTWVIPTFPSTYCVDADHP